MAESNNSSAIAILTFVVIVACVAQIHSLPQRAELNESARTKRQFNHGPFRDFWREYDGVDNFNPGFFNPPRQVLSMPPSPSQQSKRQAFDESSFGTNELIFSNNGPTSTTPSPRQPPPTSEPALWVLINNRPKLATLAPFSQRTTPSTAYSNCFSNCQTTNEYNPVCGSNQQLYFNEQKFNCAQGCGADIQIVRRGSCEGLFAMQRG